MLKQNKKVGAITVEVGIGIALAVIVLIVAIGLFNDNLAAMISNSRIANMFDNTNKATYGNFNRDYTDSQVNVQLIGEQGLAMLRNIANNKAITQIDKLFDGTDTSYTNSNSIAYLTTVINSIVGSPNICVYMKKDSQKRCTEDNIGGTLYNVTFNGNTVTISKASSGMEVKTVTMGSDFGAAQGITIKPPVGAQNTANLNPMQTGYIPANITDSSIYTYIKTLSFFADESNTVYDYDILIKAINAGNPLPTMTPEQVKVALITFLTGSTDPTNPTGSDGVVGNMQSAHNKCTGYVFWCDSGPNHDCNYPAINNAGASKCGIPFYGHSDTFVSIGEVSDTYNYANELATILSGDTSPTVLELVNNLLSQPDISLLIDTLRQDHINNSCSKFKDALQNIADANQLTIPIPACVPY